MTIDGVTSSIQSPTLGSKPLQGAATDPKPANFASLLKEYTAQMNHDHHAASKAAEALASGQGDNTSETLLAIQKADLSFQMMLSVRNKLVDAYREVMRMQV